MSAVARPRRRGLEHLLLAALLALLGACSGGSREGTLPAGGQDVKLSSGERALVAAWQAERGMSAGDALSNVMLRRYAAAGHKVRYAGDGLYEVLDRKAGSEVVATFYVAATGTTGRPR